MTLLTICSTSTIRLLQRFPAAAAGDRDHGLQHGVGGDGDRAGEARQLASPAHPLADALAVGGQVVGRAGDLVSLETI